MEKKIYQKWWFWAIVIFLGFSFYGMSLNDTENTTQNITADNIETYTLTGEQLGEYGKEIILNANTDMPTTKYIYKIPSGNYTVTTDNEKITSFFIVKDEIGTEDSEYPEILQNVGEGYLLTNGTNDLNGRAKKSVEITLNDDESIQIVGTDTIKCEKN